MSCVAWYHGRNANVQGCAPPASHPMQALLSSTTVAHTHGSQYTLLSHTSSVRQIFADTGS